MAKTILKGDTSSRRAGRSDSQRRLASSFQTCRPFVPAWSPDQASPEQAWAVWSGDQTGTSGPSAVPCPIRGPSIGRGWTHEETRLFWENGFLAVRCLPNKPLRTAASLTSVGTTGNRTVAQLCDWPLPGRFRHEVWSGDQTGTSGPSAFPSPIRGRSHPPRRTRAKTALPPRIDATTNDDGKDVGPTATATVESATDAGAEETLRRSTWQGL